jgi:hypothetical protein
MPKVATSESTAPSVPSTQALPSGSASIFGITFPKITGWFDNVAQRIPWFAWFGLGIVASILYSRRGAMRKMLTTTKPGE